MWSCAVTCHADCIRLLAGRGKNICHEHSNLHTVYNKHKEMQQSGNLKKIHHMVLTLPIGLLLLGQWHNTCKVTSYSAWIIQESNFCNNSCKNLAKMSKHIRVLWDYVEKWWHLSKIIVFHFVLWLSFKLWEPRFLNSLPYLFIVM